MSAVAAALPLVPSSSTLLIRPWLDPVVDAVGHDPRSTYVERFWLGVVGPSAVWLLRLLANELDANPDGFELPLDETARSLGLSFRGGRRSAFFKTVERCCRFQLTRLDDRGILHARRRLAPVTQWQLARLPDCLQLAHQAWIDAEHSAAKQATTSPDDDRTSRARQLAVSLLEIGEDADATERQLNRWRFGATLSRDATVWAVAHTVDRHALPCGPPQRTG